MKEVPGYAGDFFYPLYLSLMDALFALILTLLGGTLSMVFSILAWRLKKEIFFYLGITFVALLIVYIIFHLDYYIYALMNPMYDLTSILMLTFIGVSVYFLISSKTKHHAGNTDTEVTDAFLDEIIEEEDEEIDYE